MTAFSLSVAFVASSSQNCTMSPTLGGTLVVNLLISKQRERRREENLNMCDYNFHG